MSLIIMLAYLTGIMAFSTCAYAAGKFVERIRWNKLIEEGKLPRPRRKATYDEAQGIFRG